MILSVPLSSPHRENSKIMQSLLRGGNGDREIEKGEGWKKRRGRQGEGRKGGREGPWAFSFLFALWAVAEAPTPVTAEIRSDLQPSSKTEKSLSDLEWKVQRSKDLEDLMRFSSMKLFTSLVMTISSLHLLLLFHFFVSFV